MSETKKRTLTLFSAKIFSVIFCLDFPIFTIKIIAKITQKSELKNRLMNNEPLSLRSEIKRKSKRKSYLIAKYASFLSKNLAVWEKCCNFAADFTLGLSGFDSR